MTSCPDCDAPTISLVNDHVSLDCRPALAVRNALDTWFYSLVRPHKADRSRAAFFDAWHWAPFGGSALSRAAVMLAVIAKRHLWAAFTARCYGDDDEARRRGSVTLAQLVANCQVEYRARVRLGAYSWSSILVLDRSV